MKGTGRVRPRSRSQPSASGSFCGSAYAKDGERQAHFVAIAGRPGKIAGRRSASGLSWKETLGSRLRLIARNTRPPPDRSRQRYALLVDSLDDEHEQSVVQGTLSA